MKAHLLDRSIAELPITEGESVTANCGKVVTDARFAFEWIAGEENQGPVSTLLLCSTCVHLSFARSDKRMVYGLVSGSELGAGDLEGANGL